jgi:5-methylcytosine-specific restriction enzyme subunit McrC
MYEFDMLAAAGPHVVAGDGLYPVPAKVYGWLEEQCLRVADAGDGAWLRLTQRRGRKVVQMMSFVGVIRAPDGYQIEVLPKVGKKQLDGADKARQLLIRMLCCLRGFRHVQTGSALLAAARMPLLEVFIGEFLCAVEHVVKRGLRSEYRQRQDNLFALRGKLLMAPQLQQNLCRADRFFTAHDEFSTDRPENRLLHAALRRVLQLTVSRENQQLARELDFVFADAPFQRSIESTFSRCGSTAT